jgi:hypothetical protein
MKLFFKKILIFLLPVLAVFLLLETYLRNVDTLYKEKARALNEISDSVEVLVLGNSHACYGVNPTQFDLFGYNLAQPNQSLYFDKRITLQYLDRLIKLKYVLISVDFHSLYFSSQGARDMWSYYAYGIEYENRTNFLAKMSLLYGYTPQVSWVFLKNDIRAWGNGGQNLVDVEDGANVSGSGWCYFETTDTVMLNDKGCAHRAEIFNSLVTSSKEREKVLADLDDFIAKLKEKNVVPVLFTAPCFESFNARLDKQVDDQNEKDILMLIKKHDIKYWDFSSADLTASDFHNCDHLNKIGAKKFSDMINSKLKYLMESDKIER